MGFVPCSHCRVPSLVRFSGDLATSRSSWFTRLCLPSKMRGREQRSTPPRGKRFRPRLEALEDRTLLSGGLPYPTPSTVSQLTADLAYANSNAGAYTITLASNTTFNFTSADNTTNGANALPVLTGNITIVGNGDTLDGSKAVRLLDVASSGSLTLENVTLTGGLAQGTGTAAEGGAIYSAGTLMLSGVTVKSNAAQGSNGANGGQSATGGKGASASGGGLYVAGGAVTLSNDTVSGNQARGGNGGNGGSGNGGNGGNGGSGASAYVGGLYVASGSVTLTNVTLSGNQATGGNGGGGGGAGGIFIGGNGGSGASAYGGGLYVASGGLTLSNDTLSGNQVRSGSGGNGGIGGNGGSGGGGSPGGNGSSGGDGSKGGGFGPDVSGTVTRSNHDLLGDPSGSSGFGTPGSGDLLNVNPDLGPLQNNGGPTQTMALLPGSPAIDAGDNTAPSLPATDQRGYARIVGNGIDIGAYEYGATPATADLSVQVNAPAGVPLGRQIPYQLTVTNSSSIDQSNVTLGDVLPANTTLVSWTPAAGWSSSAPPAGSSSGTVSAWVNSLSANNSATFTLVVQVNSGTPPATRITNTASVGPMTGDPNPANNSVTSNTLIQYTPTVSVVDAGGTYSGSPFPAVGTALGVNNKPVSGSFSYAYYVGSSASGMPSATAPTNAGTYTVVATFSSNDPNYASGGTAQTTFTIKPATPTLSVSDAGGTYNGHAFPATAKAVGVDGKTPVSGSFSYAYYVGSSASGAALKTAPRNAGTYTVVAAFTSSNPNYSNGTARSTFTITKATTAISNLTMPPQPSTVPMPVLVQMAIDVVSLPDWSKSQALAMLETILWIGYSTASAQSPQLGSDLIWAEMGLTWDLLLAGNQPLLLLNNPHTIALANAIDDNPLYHALPGWLMAERRNGASPGQLSF